ncbi:TerB family tellurite resistance protein [Dechloromonas sp. HYN0024]|uniref:tellurite resistance TerB family protein n=1 Tax=Dechloromonas sp. HYN0024 TaxID=2231055 RepID=UPI000E42F67C|nr:TerB family tellurite resistance protein [Dechloromonas sp. HYN0024]AXS78975.1 TerB family tellurite resistance protein [Dechloromonas sp. HYN0024]AXS80284.1 TerB family tellurite resistance protein [Dechloromonas sp. HYN0024]
MRKYTNNSPEAGARLVALALMADGAIDRSEILLLERQNVMARLGLDNEQFDAIYYEYCTDMLASAQRHASGRLELDKLAIKALLDEISDPVLQKKILRILLDIVHADHRLTAGEASLIALALERWDMNLCGMTDSSVPRHCLSSDTPIRHGSTVSSTGASHHVATG